MDKSLISSLVCVDDFKKEATKLLPQVTKDFLNGGSMLEQTLQENEDSLKRWYIRPRYFVDVSECDLSTTVLGHEVKVPFGVAPTGLQKMVHEEGERASARAAAQMGTVFTLSSVATSSLEEIAEENGVRFFQLYIYKDKERVKELVHRAEKAGFTAFVVTVDHPVVGVRYRDRRNKFGIPSHIRTPHYGNPNTAQPSNDYSYYQKTIENIIDQGLTWECITWLKSLTNLPIVVKGILTAEDAVKGVEMGASAIWVSNHGGRQLDSALPTIDALEEVVAAVGDKCEVYVDGGFRTGSDIFKALAIGAKMVFLGRPIVWGLTCGGADGVDSVLNLLKGELHSTLALSGYPSVQKISSKAIVKRIPSKL